MRRKFLCRRQKTSPQLYVLHFQLYVLWNRGKCAALEFAHVFKNFGRRSTTTQPSGKLLPKEILPSCPRRHDISATESSDNGTTPSQLGSSIIERNRSISSCVTPQSNRYSSMRLVNGVLTSPYDAKPSSKCCLLLHSSLVQASSERFG